MLVGKWLKKIYNKIKSHGVNRGLSDVIQMTLWNTKYYEVKSEFLVNFTELIHMLNSLNILELSVEYRTTKWERNGGM